MCSTYKFRKSTTTTLLIKLPRHHFGPLVTVLDRLSEEVFLEVNRYQCGAQIVPKRLVRIETSDDVTLTNNDGNTLFLRMDRS